MGEKLFSYAVILHPTKKEKEKNDAKAELLIPPTPYALFSSENAVQMAAIAAVAELPNPEGPGGGKGLLKNAAERLEVAIRPF